jgi:hypothetical protein
MPRTLVVGRSPYADVVIANASVAPHHLELVVTAAGRLHITDCASPGGTWRAAVPGAAGKGEPEWTRIRQAFVAAGEPLRLGDHVCTARELLAHAGDLGDEAAVAADGNEARAARRRGRVERDAATGEIVQRRP